MRAGARERGGAIISIADIAISACMPPRRGPTMSRVSVIFHGHRVSRSGNIFQLEFPPVETLNCINVNIGRVSRADCISVFLFEKCEIYRSLKF